MVQSDYFPSTKNSGKDSDLVEIGWDQEGPSCSPRNGLRIFRQYMISFIVFVVVCYYAFKSNPSQKAFENYLKTQQPNMLPSSSGGAQLMSKWIPSFLRGGGTGGDSIKDFKYQDFVIASLMTNMRTKEVFLGVFGSWFPVQTLDGDSMVRSTLDAVEQGQSAQAESDKEVAIKAKAQKDYTTAYKYYEKAATALASGPTSADSKFRHLEAAMMHEEAAKVVAQGASKDISKLRLALDAAAELYKRYDLVRAARVYDKLGDALSSADEKEQALRNFIMARDCFEAQGDVRKNQSIQKCAALQGSLGRYPAARASFTDLLRISQDDKTLGFQAKSFMLSIGFTFIGENDYDGLGDFLKNTVEAEYPTLCYDRNFKLLKDLLDAQNSADVVEAWKMAVEEYTTISPLREKWHRNIIEIGTKQVEENELR